MIKKLHIDVETYSSVDLTTSGVYKYCESVDFEILILAYAITVGDEMAKIENIISVDLASGEPLPPEFLQALHDVKIEKHAHNANFERNCFKAIGHDVPVDQWHCSAIKAGYCGVPLGLAAASVALDLGADGKMGAGAALIRFFSIPIKPTKKNGFKLRNLPSDDPIKWADYVLYCRYDVLAECGVLDALKAYEITESERLNYLLDQRINDRGIMIDAVMAQNAYDIDEINAEKISLKLKELTELPNPNSGKQLCGWLTDRLQKEIKSVAKGAVETILKETSDPLVRQVLELNQKGSKTSIKKYTAAINCMCDSLRAHGLFQFYGAFRTGRWAGRLIQLQNLPRNYLGGLELDEARAFIVRGDYEAMAARYEDVSDILSQLIRTVFIAPKNHVFNVADFSAIEARIIAWLADERWRLDVFASHGKIYEASAAMMFDVPIEDVTKGSDLRSKGKVAELALGYQGGVGALIAMGADEMGLSETEMQEIVEKWRVKSPAIVGMWGALNAAAIRAVKTRKSITLPDYKNITFASDGHFMTIEMPNGRKLFYKSPQLRPNKWGRDSLTYMGVDTKTKQWVRLDTYGGKLTENIIQAIARDALVDNMQRLDAAGFLISMHVHDEVVIESPEDAADADLVTICEIMGEELDWAPGLILTADGYTTPYYKKD